MSLIAQALRELDRRDNGHDNSVSDMPRVRTLVRPAIPEAPRRRVRQWLLFVFALALAGKALAMIGGGHNDRAFITNHASEVPDHLSQRLQTVKAPVPEENSIEKNASSDSGQSFKTSPDVIFAKLTLEGSQQGARLLVTTDQPVGYRVVETESNNIASRKIFIDLPGVGSFESAGTIRNEPVRELSAIHLDGNTRITVEFDHDATYRIDSTEHDSSQQLALNFARNTPDVPAMTSAGPPGDEEPVKVGAPLISSKRITPQEPETVKPDLELQPQRDNDAEPLIAATPPPIAKERPVVERELKPEILVEQVGESEWKAVREALATGDHVAAKNALQAVLARAPDDYEALETLSSLYLSSGQSMQVVQLLRVAGERGYLNSTLGQTYARALIGMNQSVDAIEILRRTAPTNIAANSAHYELLANAYQRTRDFRQAGDIYHRLLRSDDSRADWWAGLGVCFDNSNNYRDARVAYQRALAIGSGLQPGLVQYLDTRIQQLEGA